MNAWYNERAKWYHSNIVLWKVHSNIKTHVLRNKSRAQKPYDVQPMVYNTGPYVLQQPIQITIWTESKSRQG